MIFRQLFDPTSSTYTYLLGDAASGEALVVDPVLEHWQRDAALLRELGLTPVATLETHVHADHVTGAWWLKRELGCEIAVSAASGAEGADRLLRHDDRVSFGSRHLQVRATPGHTRGCLTYVLDDASLALTGDCLMIRGTGRTDFQQGDARAMFRSIRDQILTLPGECLIYPAHDYRGLTASSVAEERRLIPLDQLACRVDDLSRTTPVVTICRSGARSAQAVVLLQRAGLEQVANLSGGMLRWIAEHHAVESAHR